MVTNQMFLDAGAISVIPLADPACLDRRLVGAEFAALAAVSALVACEDTVVLVGTLAGWRQPWLPLSLLEHLDSRPISVRATLVSARGADRPIEPQFHNLPSFSFAELARELPAIARRISERPDDVLAIGVQQRDPVFASVLVRTGVEEIRLRACYGLAEQLCAPLYFDEFRIGTRPPRIIGRILCTKPTATLPGVGGTETVDLPCDYRNRPVLDNSAVRRVGGLAAMAGTVLGAGVELEFGVRADTIRLVSCPIS